MGTPNLNVGYVSAAGNQKEVTINAALDALDEATQSQGDALVFVANLSTLGVAAYRGAFEFVVPGTLSATGTLTVPQTDRLFAVDNRAGAYDVVVKATSGSTATVAAGGVALLRGATSSGIYEFAQVSGGAVDSVVGNTGVISLADLVTGGVAPSADPTFTGTVDATSAADVLIPTAPFGDDSESGVNTEHLQAALRALALKPSAIAGSGSTALPANNYVNGSLGLGASLTAVANGALTVDDIALAANDRVLITGEVDPENNGLYLVIDPGDVSNPYILMRDTSMDTTDEYSGSLVAVLGGGTTYGGTIWVCTSPTGLVVGTDPVDFGAFTSGASVAYVDSKTWGYSSLPASVQKVPVTFAFSGQPGDAQMVHVPLVMGGVIPANFAGAVGFAATPATADADFVLDYLHSGTVTTVGTVTLGAASNSATLSVQAAFTLAAGNALRISAPSPQDATLADLGISFLTERT